MIIVLLRIKFALLMIIIRDEVKYMFNTTTVDDDVLCFEHETERSNTPLCNSGGVIVAIVTDRYVRCTVDSVMFAFIDEIITVREQELVLVEKITSCILVCYECCCFF